MSLSEDQLNQLMKFAFAALQGTINDRQEFAKKLEEFRGQVSQLNTVKNEMPALVLTRVDHAVSEATKKCTKELTESMIAATHAAEEATAAYAASLKKQPIIIGAIVGALGIALFFIAYLWTPSLSLIQERRAEVNRLEERISQLQIQSTLCNLKNGKQRVCVLLDPAYIDATWGGGNEVYVIPSNKPAPKK